MRDATNLHSINRSLKLALDVLLGAVVPILVLSYLSDPLGAVPAYLVPVGWVLTDLALISRRFNFITAFLGLNAIVRGLLAFWFVDGALYAFKDSVGSILVALIFAGSLLLGRPSDPSTARNHLSGVVPTCLDPLEGGSDVELQILSATALIVSSDYGPL
ncbi:MAG TPA: hypothetical protein VK869_11745 [Rubrobacteraceae bacterium]|nr:hypothetical protein [Rubrobacteraceae bacterium]